MPSFYRKETYRWQEELEGVSFGHAGAIVERGKGKATDKIKAFNEVGKELCGPVGHKPRGRVGNNKMGKGYKRGYR